MSNPFKLIDTKAPRPPRRSYARSLYDALESLKGPGTPAQIRTMLPATDDADKWPAKTDASYVERILYQTERHGYVTKDIPTGKWQIASRTLFEKRQAERKEQRERSEAKQYVKPGGIIRVDQPPQPMVVTTSPWTGFVIGALVGTTATIVGVLIAGGI